ncbi:MAG: hypothetical protein ACRDNR_07050, partial [Gaiellaceae bacterium]
VTGVLLGLGAVAFADHGNVTPVAYGDQEGEENNPSCAFLDPTWTELKVNEAPNGTYTDGTLEFTIEGSDGKVFDWVSNIGVDAVIVKGGNRGSNVYFYAPERTSDENVRSPDNTQGNVPAVSHVSVCYDAEEEPQQDEQPDVEGDDEGGTDERPTEPNERPSEPDEPQDESDDDGGTNERPTEPNERPSEPGPEDDSGTEEGEPEEEGATEPEDETGEGDVEGVTETDDGASDDVAEETDGSGGGSGSGGDDLPFTGAPLAALLLVAGAFLLFGAAGRAKTRR